MKGCMPGIYKTVLDRPFARYATAVGAIAASFLLRYVLLKGLGVQLPPLCHLLAGSYARSISGRFRTRTAGDRPSRAGIRVSDSSSNRQF